LRGQDCPRYHAWPVSLLGQEEFPEQPGHYDHREEDEAAAKNRDWLGCFHRAIQLVDVCGVNAGGGTIVLGFARKLPSCGIAR
jgi:hypothetical protein